MTMRRTLDWLGGMDFVHFALLVSLLRGSGPQPPPSIIPTTAMVGNVGHYEETLTRHKAVLDDLHGLRDDSRDSLDLPAALRDISAYVLQHQMTTNLLVYRQLYFATFRCSDGKSLQVDWP